MQWVVLTVIHTLNLCLLGYLWITLEWKLVVVAALVLLIIEVCYLAIRTVNRQLGFGHASYGLPEHVDLARKRDLETREIERKLAVLKQMAEAGEISEKAYGKARDRYRVRLVMESTSA